MQFADRVYGDTSVDDSRLLALIASPTFQRLKGIKQAGPSAFAYPFKTVTRYEHCLGAFLLLRRLGAGLKEQVAGLLHDLSHTAFSHAVDFVFSSHEQAHHEELKPVFLDRPDIVRALDALGYSPRDFYDDSVYTLLERPIPWLCADRVDYFLRDGLACGVVTPKLVARILSHIEAREGTIVLTDVAVAREAAARFAEMNRDWWASASESFIYNEFADALREGLRLGVLRRTDFYEDDAHVLERLHLARSPLIMAKLDKVLNFQPEMMVGFVPKVIPKSRWIDPPVVLNGQVKRLSEIV